MGFGLQSAKERMMDLDLEKDEFYRFLGFEQANGVKV